MIPRVLVVDDSSFVRLAVARALEADGVQVAGFARDGNEAVEKNLALAPDVIVLDLQMPRMNGVEAVRRIAQTRPAPVLVFASMDPEGARLAVEALAEGAADVLPKPTGGGLTLDLAARVWALATAQPAEGAPPPARAAPQGTPRIVVVAASTGGPPYVERLLSSLPSDFPAPLVIAQHMPAGFTRAFAQRLNAHSRLTVFEGHDGAPLDAGAACVLPGGHVGTVHVDGAAGGPFRLRVRPGASLPGAKPSATALFLSAIGAADGRVCAIVLTGMGADGADAVPAILAAGGRVIAQDPGEALISSMPNAALAAGAQTTARTARIPDILMDLTALRPRRTA